MRIICQGTPIEEMLDYNLMFEMFMDLGGHAQEEFKMYMENSWRAPVAPGLSDLNFVKPPMVDREGIIMCPTSVNQFGDAAAFHNEDGGYKSVVAGTRNISGTASGDMSTGINATNVATVSPASAIKNYCHTYLPGDARVLSSTAGGNIRAQSFTNRIDNTYVTWPSTIRPEPISKNEPRIRAEADARKYRVQDYINFLANVKNIPVGIAPAKSFIATDDAVSSLSRQKLLAGEILPANWNFQNIISHMSGKSTTTSFTVSLPIFSGILGVWAEKQFPTMLISPGSFYIQIKFAKSQHAFQCAMDPCRRVFGTYRDYVCNAGLSTYFGSEQGGNYVADFSIGGNPVTGAVTFTPGPNNVTGGAATAYVAPSSTWLAYSIPACLGTDWSWTNYLTIAAGILANQEGVTTGNAKPQYVPRDCPWLSGGLGFGTTAVASGSKCSVVRERAACFGTYLPCSTAQVRRTRN